MSEKMILVINSGSSSIKMALLESLSGKQVAEGVAERIGEPGAQYRWLFGCESEQHSLPEMGHGGMMPAMLESLFRHFKQASVCAVGHRVVHGGERFVEPTLVDDEVMAAITAMQHLAPLHNPANLLGIRLLREYLPTVAHIAVFDTAFHHAMPEKAAKYAVPYAWYERYGVRRYGFHGTSHHYVAGEAMALLGLNPDASSLISVHLGNGCSAAAIVNGISVDTTMGMTPLEGLMMGSRSGDIDPGLHAYIARQSGMSLAQITDLLNRESGLLGVSGLSNDMRTLLQAAKEGNTRAALAIEMFCYRLAKAIAGLAVAAGSVDAVIFTGGIGEHASEIRARTISQLALFGLELDSERNAIHGAGTHGVISSAQSAFTVMVIPTREEKMIARYVRALIGEQV